MDAAVCKKKISEVEVGSYPFSHFVVKNYLDAQDLRNVLTDLAVLEQSGPTSIFKSNFVS